MHKISKGLQDALSRNLDGKKVDWVMLQNIVKEWRIFAQEEPQDGFSN